jgi:hypothetical protein
MPNAVFTAYGFGAYGCKAVRCKAGGLLPLETRVLRQNVAVAQARKTGFQPVPARRHPACAARTIRCAPRQAGSPPAVTGWKPVFRRRTDRPTAISRPGAHDSADRVAGENEQRCHYLNSDAQENRQRLSASKDEKRAFSLGETNSPGVVAPRLLMAPRAEFCSTRHTVSETARGHFPAFPLNPLNVTGRACGPFSRYLRASRRPHADCLSILRPF